MKCTAAGSCTAYSSGGNGNGQMTSASAVAVDASGNVWVADSGNNRIEEFSSSGSPALNFSGGTKNYFGTNGSGAGQFQLPKGIAVDASGNLWISDSVAQTLQKCTPAGSCTLYGSGSGSGDGQFNTPQGVAVDSSGNVWMPDDYNSRVNEFTSSGSPANNFSGGTKNYFGSSGSGAGQFSTPMGIAVTPAAVTPGG